MKHYLLLTLALVLGALPLARSARADAAANKVLFDRTVDRLNFQTMEGVYDARFTRKKFPIKLLSRIDRRSFKDFNDDAAFEKLFLNYNDEAEKYKNRFGTGPLTLTAFEKALRGILIDPNFEFFLAKAARREDRAALIRRLERTIKQAVTQYDASGEEVRESARPDTLRGATATADDADNDNEAPIADAQVDALNATANPVPDGLAPVPAAAKGSSGWGNTLALLLALGAAAGVAYLLFVVVPALRGQFQQAADAHYAARPPAPSAPDDHLPPTLAEEARHRAVELRFELLADELDETKNRVRELENRLAAALAAPPEADMFVAPVDYAPPALVTPIAAATNPTAPGAAPADGPEAARREEL